MIGYFKLGEVVITPEAQAALDIRDISDALRSHAMGDWGEVDEAQRQENEKSLLERRPLLSAFACHTGVRFWVRTNEDDVDSSPQSWSEFIAEIAVRRNLVDKSVRECVTTTLIAECAKLGRKPKETIIQILPQNRVQALRVKVDRGTISELSEALFWKELCILVAKNYKWFEKLFGDLREFEFHAQIINDRPDAHAKRLDIADLALQRRSLSWIEERLSRFDM